MNKLYVGIDFSKKKFDVTAFSSLAQGEFLHEVFTNEPSGFKECLSWLKSHFSGIPKTLWMFCGENTGLYSLRFSNFLTSSGLFIWLEVPLKMKRSLGLQRGKNDKADSKSIAEYLMRHEDRAIRYIPKEKDLEAIKTYFSLRDMFVKQKKELLLHASELRRVKTRDVAARYVYERCQLEIERLNKEISNVEDKIGEIVEKNAEIRLNYSLVTSIKGVAFVNAIAFILATDNFKRFENARKLACYTGVVPFEHSSGTSVKGRARVSYIANIKLKALLTQAARAAVRFDPKIREYYERKLKEGKNANLVLNNVKNKMIHIMFAMVKNKQPYDMNHLNYYKITA